MPLQKYLAAIGALFFLVFASCSGGGDGSSSDGGDTNTSANEESFTHGDITLKASVAASESAKTIPVKDSDGKTVLTMDVTKSAATFTFPDIPTPTVINFDSPLPALPTDFVAKRMAVYVAGQIYEGSDKSRYKDSPGCDKVPVDFECMLPCCAAHDDCYKQNGCTMESWKPNHWSDSWNCDLCNIGVVGCIELNCRYRVAINQPNNCFDANCGEKGAYFDCPPNRDTCNCEHSCLNSSTTTTSTTTSTSTTTNSTVSSSTSSTSSSSTSTTTSTAATTTTVKPLRYTITDISLLNYCSGASDINNNGQVIGTYQFDINGNRHAFIYTNGTIQDIGSLPGYNRSFATAINNNGQIVGSICPDIYRADRINCHASLYSNGTMKDLGTLPDRKISEASDINDRGVTVGWSYNPTAGFIYIDGEMKQLDGIIKANAINIHGVIVGQLYNASPVYYHAVIYDGTNVIDIGSLGGHSGAHDINDHGQIVGYSEDSNRVVRAFLYSGGTMIDIGTLPDDTGGQAYAINNNGQIVGNSTGGSGGSPGFLYSGGTMYDLLTLIDSGSDWTSLKPVKINDKGQIVGSGHRSSKDGPRAFIMTPQ